MSSSRRFSVADWVDPGQWALAKPALRERWLRETAADYRETKVRQIVSGIGADGRRLARVLPTSRPDGTTDRPLIPHDDASRTIRLLRVTANARRLELVEDWHHWTRIVGYHAAGIRRHDMPGGIVVRDVIGTPGRLLRPVRDRARQRWARLYGGAVHEPPLPPPAPKPAPKPPAPTPDRVVGPFRGPLPPAVANAGPSRQIRNIEATTPTPPAQPPAPKPPAPARKPVPPPAPKPEPQPPAKPPKPAPKPEPVVVAPPPKPEPPAWTPRPAGEFREFTSVRSMEDWGKRHYEAWAESLSHAERNAMKLYAGPNYKWMNRLVRDPSAPLPEDVGPKTAESAVANARAALEKAVVPEPVVAWRGLDSPARLGIDPATLKPGDALREPAFVSTSLERSRGEDFAVKQGPGGLLLKIRVPKGAKGAYVNAGEFSDFGQERELALAPGQGNYRVVSVGKARVVRPGFDGDVPVLTVELVP